MIKRNLLLNIFNDKTSSAAIANDFQQQNVLSKLRAVDSRARRKGLQALDPSRNVLIRIGMEIDDSGNVTKNGYGVFNLSWQAEQHREWPVVVARELEEIKSRIRQTHGVPLRFVIWAGMGGSAEDKSMYNAVGLLKRGPRVYVLDSTDPAKLKNILEDITSRMPLNDALKSTLVVGMAMGMTSYEPVVNLEKLSALYAKQKIDSRPNFVYMTLPDSLLDQFGRKQGYRRIELQLDNGNSTAGRHSAPLTRGSLYPLGLCGVDIPAWLGATALDDEAIQNAFRLSAFLTAQAEAGRKKITLLLPKEWAGGAIWTKQDFEESLGKSEDFGLKVVINEKSRLANYLSPKDPAQDRCFLVVQGKGLTSADPTKIAMIRRAGYPMAILTVPPNAELSAYMQFMHYAVFGIGYLRKMNFVTQPSVELYKAITNKLFAEAKKAGGVESTKEWLRTANSPCRARWRGLLTLNYDRLPGGIPIEETDAPAIYAAILRHLWSTKKVEYGEITFFGDTRYSAQGRAIRKVLDRAADRVFRATLKSAADVYEGPAMNHSYHEMIIGHGRCFSTVLLSEKGEKIPSIDYTSDYHRAQFLATQMALAERGRNVVSITLKDLEDRSLKALDEFFSQVASAMTARRTKRGNTPE